MEIVAAPGAVLASARLRLRSVERAVDLGKGMGPDSPWSVPYEAETGGWEWSASGVGGGVLRAEWSLPADAAPTLAPTPHNEIFWDVGGDCTLADGTLVPLAPVRVIVGWAAAPPLEPRASGFQRATGSDPYDERYGLEWTVPESAVAGDVLAGTIELTAKMILKCRAAELAFFCLAHGRGERDRFLIQRLVLHEGEMPKGARAGGPFRFAIPPGAPPTHFGSVVRLDWQLELWIDVHGAMEGYAPVFTDVREQRSVRVLPPR